VEKDIEVDEDGDASVEKEGGSQEKRLAQLGIEVKVRPQAGA
jgi:hypothetical protein